jgi:excisionase family DNA binding protein
MLLAMRRLSTPSAEPEQIDPRTFGLVKATYSVREVAELLSIGRTSLYAAVRRGELQRIKLGKRTLFCATDLTAFLARLRSVSPDLDRRTRGRDSR